MMMMMNPAAWPDQNSRGNISKTVDLRGLAMTPSSSGHKRTLWTKFHQNQTWNGIKSEIFWSIYRGIPHMSNADLSSYCHELPHGYCVPGSGFGAKCWSIPWQKVKERKVKRQKVKRQKVKRQKVKWIKVKRIKVKSAKSQKTKGQMTKSQNAKSQKCKRSKEKSQNR